MWPFLAIVCKSYQFPASFKCSQTASLAKWSWTKYEKKNPFELLVMKKMCKKVLFSFYGASHAILRSSVLEKEFSFLGLSVWYHQRSCSNGRRNESAGLLCHFTQRQRPISVNVQRAGHAHIPSCSLPCAFCMDSFMKKMTR